MMRLALLLATSALAGVPSCAAPQLAGYTSTREVTGLAVAPDGTLWAATTGGVLRRAPDGSWRKWTRGDGLPSHEARGIRIAGATVTVDLPRATAAWTGESWRITRRAETPAGGAPPIVAAWRGEEYEATPEGLRVRHEGTWRAVPLPPSPGTHISALLPREGALWAALYGDGLWAYDGAAWTRTETGLPDAAREVTALAPGPDGALWIGTRRDGIFRGQNGAWTGFPRPDEPPAHDVQALAAFRDSLYVSTLEDGLAVRTPSGWESLRAGPISSDAPRQMAVFRDRLYVRHGSGAVDAYDGTAWARGVFASLPRKEVSALATDGARLYAAQWGGWSEWDGSAWTHHLGLPALQGLAVTALLPDGDTLWVGTQGKGLAEVDRRTGAVSFQKGISDDWITALACAGGHLYAGTFVGGLIRREGGRWTEFPALSGRNVTALLPDGAGGLLVGTRSGLFFARPDGALEDLSARTPALGLEVQALALKDGALWIGDRTGLWEGLRGRPTPGSLRLAAPSPQGRGHSQRRGCLPAGTTDTRHPTPGTLPSGRPWRGWPGGRRWG